ncbi:MAG TPA: flagellar basal-body MS-ring/collar protein FliF [Negativicutes bacterium]|nr:flagellar basal-body MS-ring/collar protein FliF [Negativicutes bacterium]
MADWKEQSLSLWQNLGKRERYMIAGAAVLVFVVIIGWSLWWGGRPDNVPLFTGMDAKDAGEVAAKLKEIKVPYEIGNNGTAILVSSKDVYRVRLELASQGLPRGYKGFEIFDQTKFGATEFQNKVYYLQALQGELTRTIEQMAEVEKARVHIVLPEDSLYKKNEKAATASIMLKLRPSTQLSREQVKGIVNLVAHSIQGLKPENVTVVDNFAHVLNDQQESQQPNGVASMTQLEMTRKVQDGLQKSVQTLLEQVLGPGKSAVRVSVELSFDQKTVDRQVFEPVVDDKGIIRSSQDVSESFKGTSPSPGGVPGTTSNIPGYVTGNSGQSQYEKKEATRNYEINELKEKTVVAPGSIRRLTVSVLVDANVNNAQRDSITKAVSSAIGFNTARGDVISVESIPFSTELADKQRKEEEELAAAQKSALYMKLAAAAVAVIALLFVIRTYLRRRQGEEEQEVMEIPMEPQPAHIMEAAAKELTPQEKERMAQREAITKLAKSKPDEVAQLIKAWVNEE